MTNNVEIALSFFKDGELHSAHPTLEKIIEAKQVLEVLSALPTRVLLEKLPPVPLDFSFSPSTIPQFSSLDDCFDSVNKLIRSGLDGVKFATMGFFLRTGTRNKVADRKYGENHSKCAELMGLCRLNNGIWRNAYSYAYEALDESTKEILKPKLCLGIMLIRGFFTNGQSDDYIKRALNCLSSSTQIRRQPNIKSLIETVKNDLE